MDSSPFSLSDSSHEGVKMTNSGHVASAPYRPRANLTAAETTDLKMARVDSSEFATDVLNFAPLR